ncbi:MAG: cobyric acid synthase CobQ, partial [Magnetococcales bacterium]|nr:cobyric acid synthase CobQ [Magnetococcales bacterium]
GQKDQEGLLRVVVPRFPRLSNHTDLDPLIHHPLVDVRIIEQGERIPAADLILLPGSKNVRQDMQWMEEQGWRQAILRHLRYGGKILGICGGFQMLGERIKDPLGQEGSPGACAGLGVLAMETEITAHKHLCHNQGTLAWSGAPVSGYEIHMGVSTGAALHHPAMFLQEGPHGALSEDGQIMGCYLHGLLDQPGACQSLLTWAGMQGSTVLDIRAQREASLERLADTLASTLDGEALATLLPGVL